jgi:hypothetical protein
MPRPNRWYSMLNDLGHHPFVVATVPIALLALTAALVWRSARRRFGEQPLTVS